MFVEISQIHLFLSVIFLGDFSKVTKQRSLGSSYKRFLSLSPEVNFDSFLQALKNDAEHGVDAIFVLLSAIFCYSGHLDFLVRLSEVLFSAILGSSATPEHISSFEAFLLTF